MNHGDIARENLLNLAVKLWQLAQKNHQADQKHMVGSCNGCDLLLFEMSICYVDSRTVKAVRSLQ